MDRVDTPLPPLPVDPGQPPLDRLRAAVGSVMHYPGRHKQVSSGIVLGGALLALAGVGGVMFAKGISPADLAKLIGNKVSVGAQAIWTSLRSKF